MERSRSGWTASSATSVTAYPSMRRRSGVYTIRRGQQEIVQRRRPQDWYNSNKLQVKCPRRLASSWLRDQWVRASSRHTRRRRHTRPRCSTPAPRTCSGFVAALRRRECRYIRRGQVNQRSTGRRGQRVHIQRRMRARRDHSTLVEAATHLQGQMLRRSVLILVMAAAATTMTVKAEATVRIQIVLSLRKKSRRIR